MRAETRRAARLASPTHITQGEKIHKLFAYALKHALHSYMVRRTRTFRPSMRACLRGGARAQRIDTSLLSRNFDAFY